MLLRYLKSLIYNSVAELRIDMKETLKVIIATVKDIIGAYFIRYYVHCIYIMNFCLSDMYEC